MGIRFGRQAVAVNEWIHEEALLGFSRIPNGIFVGDDLNLIVSFVKNETKKKCRTRNQQLYLEDIRSAVWVEILEKYKKEEMAEALQIHQVLRKKIGIDRVKRAIAVYDDLVKAVDRTRKRKANRPLNREYNFGCEAELSALQRYQSWRRNSR